MNILYYVMLVFIEREQSLRQSVKMIPKIEPIIIIEYVVYPDNYHMVGTVPIRSFILGHARSGTSVLHNMTFDKYNNC